MTEAGGTTTIETINNGGQYSLYKISNSSWDSTETITIPTTETQIKAEDQVIIVGALNETTEKQLGGAALTVEYDETAKAFTPTESGAADDVMTIWFYHVPA